MSRAPSSFDVELFARHRRDLDLAWGEPLHHREETGSTNDDALAAARSGAPSGSVFVADHQTSGRGRSGRSWQSRAGAGLLFSLLLRPESSAGGQAALTLAVGLGVRAALAAAVSADFAVKWPNDVLAQGRKVAGVLCEAQLEQTRILCIVIGVGINIGQLPHDLAAEATSLSELLPPGAAPPGREQLLAQVLASVERYVASCSEHGFAALGAEFAQFDALSGRHVRVTHGTELAGVARGVDAEGRLLIEEDGVIVPVRSGTVRIGA